MAVSGEVVEDRNSVDDVLGLILSLSVEMEIGYHLVGIDDKDEAPVMEDILNDSKNIVVILDTDDYRLGCEFIDSVFRGLEERYLAVLKVVFRYINYDLVEIRVCLENVYERSMSIYFSLWACGDEYLDECYRKMFSIGSGSLKEKRVMGRAEELKNLLSKEYMRKLFYDNR